jgi:hypothetical protein
VRRLLRAIDARDISAGVGLTLVTIGVAQVNIPAAFIVPGVALIGLALWRIR